MSNWSFKMSGATWFIDMIGPVKGRPGLVEYYVAEYLNSKCDEDHFVGHRNMILDENVSEKEVRSKIRGHYLDGHSENIRQKRVFYKPAFI